MLVINADMDTHALADEPYLTPLPTLAGGVSAVEVHTFYDALIARAAHRHSSAKKELSK